MIDVHMVALAPMHDRAFVASIGSGSMSPEQREGWVTNRGGDTVSIIDVASSKIVATLDSKSVAIRAKFTDDGKHVLVSNARRPDGLGCSPLTLQSKTFLRCDSGERPTTSAQATRGDA